MNTDNHIANNKLKVTLSDQRAFIIKALRFADQFDHFSLLQPNGHKEGFDHVLAFGGRRIVNGPTIDQLQLLKDHLAVTKGNTFGYFSYDAKNALENLSSENPILVGFPELFFFEPEIIIRFSEDSAIIEAPNPEEVQVKIESQTSNADNLFTLENLYSDFSKSEYISRVSKLREHIANGDIYEVNYCMQLHGICNDFDPINAFTSLIEYSPTPFSCLLKNEKHYLISASPERFIKKTGNKLISQPIKGTAPRGKSEEEDKAFIRELINSKKERAENLMVVDLVRNDLSRSAKVGTVNVDELFGIYTFKQVHQMISTISCELDDSATGIEALLNAYPMASMTGMPKIMAMQLIDSYEKHSRGLFSGSVGYFNQNGDFDFNVVIRSILFDAITKKVAFPVGSAITYDSVPENEYEECLLKAKAILSLFKCTASDIEVPL